MISSFVFSLIAFFIVSTTTFIIISNQSKDTPQNYITDIYTELLEQQIREEPSQYFWTHKRFKHARLKKGL